MFSIVCFLANSTSEVASEMSNKAGENYLGQINPNPIEDRDFYWTSSGTNSKHMRGWCFPHVLAT